MGNGFFNDTAPVTYPVGQAPSGLFLGNFTGSGQEIATLNAGSNTISLIGPAGVIQTIGAGGLRPVSGFAGDFNGNGFTDLVVGDNGDGRFALFTGGPGGLTLSQTITNADVPSPTSLSFAGVADGVLSFYASTEGARRRRSWRSTSRRADPRAVPCRVRALPGESEQSAGPVLASATAGVFQQVAQLLNLQRLAARPGRSPVHRVGHRGRVRRRILRRGRGRPAGQLRAGDGRARSGQSLGSLDDDPGRPARTQRRHASRGRHLERRRGGPGASRSGGAWPWGWSRRGGRSGPGYWKKPASLRATPIGSIRPPAAQSSRAGRGAILGRPYPGSSAHRRASVRDEGRGGRRGDRGVGCRAWRRGASPVASLRAGRDEVIAVPRDLPRGRILVGVAVATAAVIGGVRKVGSILLVCDGGLPARARESSGR